MRVNLREYMFEHGKKPSGRGRWAFAFSGIGGIFTSEHPFRVGWDAKSRQLPTYEAAKKHACQFAKAVGATSVTVLP